MESRPGLLTSDHSFGDSPVGRPLRRGETFDEVYWRIYVKHQPGWTGSPAKMSRATSLTSERWTQAFILHVWSSGAFLTLDPATKQLTGDPEAAKLWSREYRPGWEPKV